MSATSSTTSTTSPPLSLGRTWTLWFDRGGQRGQTQAEYEQGITEVGSIATVDDFWRYWSPLTESGAGSTSPLPERCNLLLFKRGVRPTWEDAENVGGGRYTITAPRSVAETVATNVVLEIVGEQLPWPDHITGVVVRMRPAAHTIDVWNRSPETNIVAATTEHLTRLIASLNLPAAAASAVTPVRYQLHSAASAPSAMTPRSMKLSSSGESSPHLPPLDAPAPRQQQQSVASPSPSRRGGGEGVVDRLEGLAPEYDATVTAAVGPRKPTTQLHVQLPRQQQQKGQEVRVRSKDDSHLTAASSLPSEQQQRTPAWMTHKKAASEDVRANAIMGGPGHVRRVSGVEQAVPVLLRQGFDVPAAAYVELAQIRMHAETPPDSPRALQCQHLLRSRGGPAGPGLFTLPPGYMQHRRAYSLDRSADDLRQAYDSYNRAKRNAFLSETGQPALSQLAALGTPAATPSSSSSSSAAIPGIVLNEQVSPVAMMEMYQRKGSQQEAGVQRSALSSSSLSETLADPAIVAAKSQEKPEEERSHESAASVATDMSLSLSSSMVHSKREGNGFMSSATLLVVSMLLILLLAVGIPAALLINRNM